MSGVGSFPVGGAGVGSFVGGVVTYDAPPARAGTYTLTLTGDGLGTDDVLLPCSNFLARIRSGRRSYFQATVPYTSNAADQIAARSQQDLVLHWYDQSDEGHQVLSVKLDGVSIARGVRSSSINLRGWRQSTNTTPATHGDIKAAAVLSGTTSSVLMVPGYWPDIRPADTVEVDGLGFIADTVTVQAAARRNDIEVTTTISEG